MLGSVTIGRATVSTLWQYSRPIVLAVFAWAIGFLVWWRLFPVSLVAFNDKATQLAAKVSPVVGVTVATVVGRWLVGTSRAMTAWASTHLTVSSAVTNPSKPYGFSQLLSNDVRRLYESNGVCMNVWMARVRPAFATLLERSRFYTERQYHGELSFETAQSTIGASTTSCKPMDWIALQRVLPSQSSTVIWISGRGGSGKSQLACRIAVWANSTNSLEHPLILLIGEDVPNGTTLEEFVLSKVAAVAQSPDISIEFVGDLLRTGRLILIFDGLSERADATQRLVNAYLQGAKRPMFTICTSRSSSSVNVERLISIEPGALDPTNLLAFLTSYRASLPPTDQYPEHLTEPIRLAAISIADAGSRPSLTPLLLTLLAKQAQAYAAEQPDAKLDLPRYAAVAILWYVDRIVGRTGRLQATQLAKAVLKDYQPGSGLTRDRAITILDPGGDSAVQALIDSGLLETVDSDGMIVRFSLDPVAEYLVAFDVIGSHAQLPAFRDFLKSLPPATLIRGFLVALKNCIDAYGEELGVEWPSNENPDDAG